MLRPYKVRRFDPRPHNSQHPVDMIRHDNKRLELDLGKMKRDLKPGLLDYTSHGGQAHSTVDDFAEKATLSVRADGNEVESALGIVETLKADGPAVQCGGF